MTYRITLEFTGPLDIPQEGESRSGIVVQQLIAHLQQSAITFVEALPVQSFSPIGHNTTEGFVSNDTQITFVFEVEDAAVFEGKHYLHYVLDRLRESNVTVQQVAKHESKTQIIVAEA